MRRTTSTSKAVTTECTVCCTPPTLCRSEATRRWSESTALFQNTPNPFNPQTVIAFDLARASQVQVAVYDLNGSLVRELANEYRAAGVHSLVWDGRDGAGEQVASGTYFYRLVNAEETISRKMTLLK